MQTLHEPPLTDPGRDVRRAWWSLVLFVPSFVLAFVVGEGTMSALGYSSGQDVPLWVYPTVGIPACLVFALPLLVTVPFGRRAVRAGERAGWWPIAVGVVVAGGFFLQNLVSLVATLLIE